LNLCFPGAEGPFARAVETGFKDFSVRRFPEIPENLADVWVALASRNGIVRWLVAEIIPSLDNFGTG
jgi:hypothetical protein